MPTGVHAGVRQQLIKLVHAGRSANDVAKEFGLHATTVAAWVGLSPTGTPAPASPPIAQANCGASKGTDDGNSGRPKRQFEQPLKSVCARCCLAAHAIERISRFVSGARFSSDTRVERRPAICSTACSLHRNAPSSQPGKGETWSPMTKKRPSGVSRR